MAWFARIIVVGVYFGAFAALCGAATGCSSGQRQVSLAAVGSDE
jgi:hypothetical protein